MQHLKEINPILKECKKPTLQWAFCIFITAVYFLQLLNLNILKPYMITVVL